MPPLKSPNFTLDIGLSQKKSANDARLAEKQGLAPPRAIFKPAPGMFIVFTNVRIDIKLFANLTAIVYVAVKVSNPTPKFSQKFELVYAWAMSMDSVNG